MNDWNTEINIYNKPTNEELYHKQMELLKTFLEHGAISQAQYDKSSHDLTEKMGYGQTNTQK